MFGKVTSSRARRPNVSIVRTAGQAKLWIVSFSVHNYDATGVDLREVYETKAPGEKERGPFTRLCVLKESRGVESHNVDCHDMSRLSQRECEEVGWTHFHRTAVPS